MAAKHYSDAQLLSLLDGEFSHMEKARSWFHLRRCWACRAGMAELELTAHRLALALQRDDYPGRERVDRAKQGFLAAVAAGMVRTEQTVPAPRTLLVRRKASWLALASSGGLVLAATGTIGFFVIRSSSALRPPKSVPSRSQPAGVAVSPSPPTPPRVAVAKVPETKAPAVSAPPETATSSQLEAAEIEARYALHRANLDLSPVEYVVEPGVLTIRGFSAEQAEALSFLGKRSYVRLRFEAPAATEGEITRLETRPATGSAPVEVRLESWFAKQSYPSPEDRNRAYTAYLNEIVSQATIAQRAAARLRLLAARYHTAPLIKFSSEHRWLLEAMIRDHLSALDVSTERERLLLDQVFPGQATSRDIRSVSPSAWSEVCLGIFAEVSAVQGSIIELFTSRDAAKGEIGEVIANVQNHLNHWPNLRAQAENVISRQFNETEDKP